MKLELDINPVRNSSFDNHSDHLDASDEVKKMLRSGINLAKEGNRAEARQMLLKVTEAESNNETAWLWLASISEYPEELLVFLQNVLKINPENERALEWAKQTRTLLSKTFVQRGINASRENQKDFAKQCFLQGIVHDSENEMAWLWLASTSEAQEEKISHLQKVLQINPNNETALSSLNAVKSQMSQSLLRKANSAAISGDRETAKQLLESIMKNTPNLEEAWVLKAYLADEYYEKIGCYQKALELNPENEAAQAGLASLQALAAKVSKPVAVTEPVFKEELPTFEQPLEMKEEVSDEIHEEILEQLEDYPEVEEFEQPLQELVDEPMVENFYQPLEEVQNEEVLVEDSQVETESFDEPQTEVEPFVQEELFVVEENKVEEFVAEENQYQVEMEVSEPADSPTQELDEEYTRTADAVFNSFEQSEAAAEEDLEVSQEFQYEPQTFAEPVEEKVAEEFQVEYSQPIETVQPEAVLAYETVEEAQHQTVEEASVAGFQSPYFNNNGFEMVPDAPFAETVELSYSNLKVTPEALEEAKESLQSQQEEVFVQESFSNELNQVAPVQAFEYQEPSTNGFAHEVQVNEEVAEEVFEEEVEEPVAEFVEEVQPQVVSKPEVQPQFVQCSFCEFENEVQTVVCHSCQTMLSLSDLEMLLAHQGADQDLLLSSIEKMEIEKTLRDFSVEELTVLGVGHLNAKNLRKGFSYLQEASQLNPNDVVLSSKVNFLAIRLNEIEEHDNKALENPVQSRTIMVVDDSPTVRKLISGKLEKCGHSVISAIDGMDALAKINEVIPDLILLDITMPRLDGYQVCKLIRNNEITKDIPIVMISGKDGFFDKVRGRMAGSSGYITKPFGPDTLMKTIESYLN